MNAFKARFDNCYWCGRPAISKEHVPPQNLFPKGYRIDLMKVGACRKHNELFSKLDERLRIHMVLNGDANIAKKYFEEKVMKGLKRNEGAGLKTDILTNSFLDLDGKRWQGYKTTDLNLYFEKIIRGLLYYHHGLHLIGSISYFSNKLPHLNLSANAHFYYYLIEDELSDFWVESNSKNKDIFDYKYFYSQETGRFFVIMKFYREHKVIGVSIPEGMTIDDYGLEYEDYLAKVQKRNTVQECDANENK